MRSKLSGAGNFDLSYLEKAMPNQFVESSIEISAKVDASGYVQGVCAVPAFDRVGMAPEGQAFFLLMEAAWKDTRHLA